MKKLLLLTLVLLFVLNCNSQVIPINNGIYGQNANLTDTVGRKVATGGKLQKYWQTTAPLDTQNYVRESRVYYMRYGGIDVEKECLLDGIHNQGPPSPSNYWLTRHDYIRKALVMQDNGITPILTLPLSEINDDDDDPTFGLAANLVASLVKDVNDSLTIKYSRAPVLHWVYSNEPEEGGKISGIPIHGYDSTNAPQMIHDYIKAYWIAIYNGGSGGTWNNAWGTPVFIGPELYGYDNYNHGTGKVNELIKQLTGQSPYGTVNSILPYIKVFSWHYYPFNDESTQTQGIAAPTRENVIDILQKTTGVPRYLSSNSRPLLSDINEVKGYLPSTIDVAITEANICHMNDLTGTFANDNVTGTGANSFIAGQFWAEMMSVCMEGGMKHLDFWSSLEGQSADAYKTNIGYLNSDPSRFGGVGGKKSTYYHFKMMSDNFHGNFYRGTYNHNSVAPTPPTTYDKGIKTFASFEPAGIKIVVLNQHDDPYDFHINFNNSATNVAGRVTLNYNLTGDPTYPTLTTFSYDGTFSLPKRSTTLLTFDCNGTFVSRTDYTEDDAVNDVDPHLRQVGTAVLDPMVMKCGMPGGIGGTINTNTTYTNDTVYVNSNILVTATAKLTFLNCLVVMAPNTEIKANPQASIELTNSTMLGCDGKKWTGIIMNGNYHAGLKLLIQNSYIIGAVTPVKAVKLSDLKIANSVFANGTTAINLDRSELFTISGNLFAGFKTGVQTTKTKADFASTIKENLFFDLETAMKFADDAHNKLDIVCNQIKYRQEGIKSVNTDLKEQGTLALSAGNDFIKTTSVLPSDYVDHTGTATKYYYGPLQTAEFSFPSIMNIPIIQATADRVCPVVYALSCPPWIVGVEEQVNDTKPQMLVYPNPSQGDFIINFSNLPKGNWTLNVHDVMGRLISTKKVDSNSESTILQINAKGLYFVSLQSGDNRITQKVIVE